MVELKIPTMWLIKRRESEIGYRISKLEQVLTPDLSLQDNFGPTETDIDSNLRNIHKGNDLIARSGRFVIGKARGISFDIIIGMTGASVAGYAKNKYPSMLASVLPDMPDIVSYGVYSAAGATVGYYLPRGIVYAAKGTIAGYRAFKSNYKIGL